MSDLPLFAIDSECDFDRDSHAYRDVDGSRRISCTQAIKMAGLIDYSMVPPQILAAARNRGQLVHHAAKLLDKGESPWEYDTSTIDGYIDAYLEFCQKEKFVADPDWVERPFIIDILGHRVGMTPDAVGTLDGVPGVIERKATAAAHPAWRIQTGGYKVGLQAAGLQIRFRMAVQLFPTGKYKAWPHDDVSDEETFFDCVRLAAWKIKHRLVELDQPA